MRGLVFLPLIASFAAACHKEAPSCDELQQVAGDRLTPALRVAESDESCQTDADCVSASIDTDCTRSCGDLLNKAGAASVQAAIATINREVCPAFLADQCPLIEPPCTPRGNPTCVQGRCAYCRPGAGDAGCSP